jgi:hypothetical protein
VQFRVIGIEQTGKSPPQLADGICETTAHFAPQALFIVPHALACAGSTCRKGMLLLQSFGDKSLKIGAKSSPTGLKCDRTLRNVAAIPGLSAPGGEPASEQAG